MAITQTGDRNIFAAITRAARCAWFGANSTNNEAPPVALNNEYLKTPNAAGTAYANMIKVNTADVPQIGDNAVIGTPSNLTGGIVTTDGTQTLTGKTLTSPTLNTPALVGTGQEYGIYGANFSPSTSSAGTSVTAVANKQWIAPVFLPINMTVTGLAFLIGTVGGTDKAIVALYNNAGVLVANSAVTTSGSTVGTAANLQKLDFTAPYPATGPANYWASVQISGTTATFRAIPAQVSVAAVGSQTNATATPASSITPPTSFTADTAPILEVY